MLISQQPARPQDMDLVETIQQGIDVVRNMVHSGKESAPEYLHLLQSLQRQVLDQMGSDSTGTFASNTAPGTTGFASYDPSWISSFLEDAPPFASDFDRIFGSEMFPPTEAIEGDGL